MTGFPAERHLDIKGDIVIRTYLKNNGVTRPFPFVRGDGAEDEAYRDMSSPSAKPEPNGNGRSSQATNFFHIHSGYF